MGAWGQRPQKEHILMRRLFRLRLNTPCRVRLLRAIRRTFPINYNMNTNTHLHLESYLKQLMINARDNGLNGDQILARSRECEIEGYLYAAMTNGLIKPADLNIDDISVQKRIEKYRVKQTARVGLWIHSLKNVCAILQDTPFILLKGIGLSERWFGEYIWRNSNDIDLLVPENQWRPIASRLIQCGYYCEIEPHEWATNQIQLKHKVLASVEIHWKLAPPPWKTPSFEYLYKRRQMITIRDVPIPVLSDGDLWINLLIHAQQHFYAPKTMLDLCECIDHVKPDLCLLDAYGLNKLYAFVNDILSLDPRETSHPAGGCMALIALIRKVLYKAFSNQRYGQLCFGDDSRADALAGIFIKLFNMRLLDGTAYQLKSMWMVVFYGPHRFGAWVNRLSHGRS